MTLPHRLALPLAAIAVAMITACQPASGPAETAATPTTGSPEVTADATATGITAGDAWIRATLPDAPVAGAFLTITNGSGQADRLVAASTDAAERVEIHETRMEDGMMKMRQLTDGIALAAGETVSLAPGGLHMMLMAPTRQFVAGETVEIELEFEHAPRQRIAFSVREMDAGAHGNDAGHAH